MKRKNQLPKKGSALLLSMLVITLLSILGLGIWQYTAANIKQSLIPYYQKQAYYYARGGAEMARGLIITLQEEDPSIINDWEEDHWLFGTFDPLNIEYHTEEPAAQGISFKTEIGIQLSDNQVIIRSTGFAGNYDFEEEQTLLLRSPALFVPVENEDYEKIEEEELAGKDYPEFKDYGWSPTGGPAGVMNQSVGDVNNPDYREGSVVFEGAGSSLRVNTNDPGVFIGADSLFFQGTRLTINNNGIMHLYADTIYFYGEFVIEGDLCLFTSPSNESTPGFVYFGEDVTINGTTIESGAYHFPHSGICLPGGFSGGTEIKDWQQEWQ